MKRSLGQKLTIYGTFEMYETNLRGTAVENGKKVKNQSTLLCNIRAAYQLQYMYTI
jgi:hypothetical protein